MKKELTLSQKIAIRAYIEKFDQLQREFQNLLDEIANELEIPVEERDKWYLSRTLDSFEKKDDIQNEGIK